MISALLSLKRILSIELKEQNRRYYQGSRIRNSGKLSIKRLSQSNLQYLFETDTR